MLMTIQYYRTAIQNQNQNQNQNQFEIIGNSSTVPVPEFQYCPDPVNEFSGRFPENSRAARDGVLQRLEKIVDQGFPRAVARARVARAWLTQQPRGSGMIRFVTRIPYCTKYSCTTGIIV